MNFRGFSKKVHLKEFQLSVILEMIYNNNTKRRRFRHIKFNKIFPKVPDYI